MFNKKESLTLSNKWEFFITTVEDNVTGIRVDIGAIEDEKFDRLIHTWFLRVRYTHCYENGFPQPDETQRLNRIEDWLEAQGKTLPIWLVGVVTQQGSRDFVFQSEKDLDWEKTLDKLLAGGPELACSFNESKTTTEITTASFCIQPNTTGTGYTIPEYAAGYWSMVTI